MVLINLMDWKKPERLKLDLLSFKGAENLVLFNFHDSLLEYFYICIIIHIIDKNMNI